jgi:uncharacterized membrane protein
VLSEACNGKRYPAPCVLPNEGNLNQGLMLCCVYKGLAAFALAQQANLQVAESSKMLLCHSLLSLAFSTAVLDSYVGFSKASSSDCFAARGSLSRCLGTGTLAIVVY